MPLVAILLVLAAAICHATWNLVAKRAGGGSNFVLIGAILVGVVWAPLAFSIAPAVLVSWGWREWCIILASALVHILYFRALLHGYAVSDLTVVYPVARGSGPLLSTLGAIVVLGESISAAGLTGAAAVVVGVFFVAGGPRLWRGAPEAGARERVRRGVLWGALTGAFIAGYSVIDGYAVKVMLISPILVDYLGNILRIPLILPLVLRDRAALARAWRSQWRAALVIAVLGPLSYVMVLYAVRLAPLSHVAPARELSMLFAALFGGSLLGESDRGLRLLGAVSIAAGVTALALG